MTDDLAGRVATALDRPVVPEVRDFARKLGESASARAVLFYGSNLRTGSLEGVLDFYVLTPGPRESGIWPRVSYHEWEHDGVPLRAKVATMTLATFRAAAEGVLLDTTIWARFVQPSALAWARDEDARQSLVNAICRAARTAARLAVSLGPVSARPEDYWKALFRATYAAEFRVEAPGREDSILSVNREHFEGLLPLALEAERIPFDRDADGRLTPHLNAEDRARTRTWWKQRRLVGKPYNLVRLVRASTTFEGAARYAAWKIERHTGVPIEVTPWRERHPVLAAPGVLWQVWRARRKTA